MSEITTWQPIETAPKGQKVLLYYPPMPGRRGRDHDNPAMYAVDYAGMTPRKPSHWMLLPPPPQPAGLDGIMQQPHPKALR